MVNFFPVLLSMNKVYGCTLMVDAKLLIKSLPVPPNWSFDAWVPCMVAVHSGLTFIPEPLFYYRIHAAQSGIGASLPTMSEKVKQWKYSAKDYWKDSEPQLADLYTRLTDENIPGLKPYLVYIRGRMGKYALSCRASIKSFAPGLQDNPESEMLSALFQWREEYDQGSNCIRYLMHQ